MPAISGCYLGRNRAVQGRQDAGKAMKNTSINRARTASDFGAAAVEYALLVGLIAVAVIAGAVTLGHNLGHTFNTVATTLPTA
ncbi:MAG: Flp/Fap pilin component [Actinomycetota bacterium]|jgi:Flp pilus assembly pilin Flp